jgi:HlyD family secretion protein
VTESDLEDARLAGDAAHSALKDGESSVTRANAVVNEAMVNLDHATIRSPIDGFVVSRNVDIGQTLVSVVQAQPLFRIAADLKEMQVMVDVDQSDVAGLKAGEPATFEVEAYPRQIFHGTLRLVRLEPVVAVAQSSVVSYTGVVDVDNASELLRPGMTAEVTFDGPRRDASVRIPNNALSFRPSTDVLRQLGETPPARGPASAASAEDSGARIVWEYDGSKLKPVPVRPGLTDATWTELVSGPLHPGDRLVTGAILERRSRL